MTNRSSRKHRKTHDLCWIAISKKIGHEGGFQTAEKNLKITGPLACKQK